MDTAVRVLETGLSSNHFQFVLNDTPGRAALVIDGQVTSGLIDDNHNSLAREVAHQLLQDTKRNHPGTH